MLFLIALVLISSYPVEPANILGIFPTPSISHQVVFHALVKDLAARGHHLTVLTTDLIKINNPNVTQIDLHDSYEVLRTQFNFVEYKESKSDELDLFRFFVPVMMDYLEDQLSHPEVKKLINKSDKKHFDLLIFEYLNYIPVLAFAEIYDCPAVGITSLETVSTVHEDFGNIVNPVIHPDITFSYAHGQLTFDERWRSLKYYLKMKYGLQREIDSKFQEILHRHFPMVTKSMDDMKGRVQLLMTNTNPAMGFIRPLLPNTIQLGFMHIEPPKPLPADDLKTFLDSSRNGVIYMSLGSNVQSKDLSPEVLQIFLKVFGSLSYDVLWKFEADNLPNKPDNVKISKWLPQSDLLAHPKIKLFITQGGQQSMEEAIDRMIPMVVIPFLGDQDANAKRVVRKEVGIHLELHTMTESKLLEAINEVQKPKYKTNILKLRELVYDQPMTSRDRAVWWTEYIIRHKGANHLEYPGKSVPFYQKYWFDFIGISVSVLVLVFVVIKSIIKFMTAVSKIKKE